MVCKFLNLFKKNILITGASDGIGKEVAKTYFRHGANLLLIGKNREKMNLVKRSLIRSKKFSQKIENYIFDLSEKNESKYFKLTQKIRRDFPTLDGLVHNAGILGKISPLINQTIRSWNKVLQVNLNSVFIITKFLLPCLLNSKNGSLLFTTSNVVKDGKKNWSPYSVSKSAIEGLMKTLYQEYQDSSLRINCINPGAIRTKMRLQAYPSESRKDDLKTPGEIMSIYLYLMSDKSIGISGRVFSFDRKSQCFKPK
ncbi:YciK family oxidoreductase [Candidatus Riesia pediculischaeffi]|uniref:3-oxoacyl-ACP reductase n=1 Tax=Candidatus Riesia pediculischaeffi TaxID=428411 RepID=A0A1V0HKS5_9ENTR|nr:YciK family oxidoreductase [Candidatus Riesia pediculischaeffi]ARC53321.1 hypothetical protein AOQ87_01355 [Candidatus Riesia pediculischaeffi]